MAKENPESRQKRFIVRAGLFVSLGLALAGLVILLIGKERRLFDEQITYRAAFDNVDGLKLDSPVRLGGLEVGRVAAITFAPDLGDKRIVVLIEMPVRFSQRVRGDSVARVAGRGVLGDKAVDISLGSPDAEPIAAGGEMMTGSSGDITTLLKSAGEVMDNTVAISRDIRAAVAAYSDPQLTKDATAVIRSLKMILGEIETGKGPLHALVYDNRVTHDMKGLLGSMAKAAVRLDGALAAAEGILNEVHQGDGFAHALIYEKKAGKALADIGSAAGELAILVRDARTSKTGAVHQLVYGDSRGMLSNLTDAAANLKQVTEKVNRGEGSLGGLINDPTVYEDLKQVLGNVRRNWVLRELVRMSISNGENMDALGKPVGSE
jgi:phospholipid/cholesterol/gamma-HCH transport system substrate-binding protein